MKKLFASVLILSALLSLFSCSESEDAYTLISQFAEAYGASGTVYSPTVSEGDAGYTDEEFYKTLYMSDRDTENDYAVFLSEGLDAVYECACFITEDESSYLAAYELCISRIEFLRKMGYATSPVVIRRRGTVFYSTLPDGERAEKIWRRIFVS